MVVPGGQDDILLIRPTFALKVVDVVAADFTRMSFSVKVSNGSYLTSDSFSSDSTNPTASITFPSEVIFSVGSDTFRIVFQTFLQDSFYQSLDSEFYKESEVNSIILVADLISEGSVVDVHGLSNPVKLQFTKLRDLVS